MPSGSTACKAIHCQTVFLGISHQRQSKAPLARALASLGNSETANTMTSPPPTRLSYILQIHWLSCHITTTATWFLEACAPTNTHSHITVMAKTWSVSVYHLVAAFPTSKSNHKKTSVSDHAPWNSEKHWKATEPSTKYPQSNITMMTAKGWNSQICSPSFARSFISTRLLWRASTLHIPSRWSTFPASPQEDAT